MIKNGVIDASQLFAQRRHMIQAEKDFEILWAKILQRDKVDIECCRESYRDASKFIFNVLQRMAGREPVRIEINPERKI